MIGLYLSRQGDTVDPAIVRKFVASLGVGLDGSVGSMEAGRALLAAHCPTPSAARVWQAATVPSGGLALFTGFISNVDALRRELGVETRDPAALYATGYARWGDAIDRKAIGAFATILVFPDARRVRCVRSPFQAPPLHIWHDRERTIVASLARILFSTGEHVAEIDEQKIADSLYLNYADAERGWYKGVTRVRTGHRVTIDDDGIAARRYYDTASLPRIELNRDDEYVEAATALLADGTRGALAGFTAPAVSLSGGYDSQGVAAFAVDALGPDRPLLGLTAVPEAAWGGEDLPGTFGDERGHVAALAAMYPTLRTETVDAAGLSFDHRLAAMFLMGGMTPRNTMNLHWIHAIRARAKARGCDVLLTGTMGNLSFSFSGVGAMPSWLMRGQWRRLAHEVNAVRGPNSFTRTFAAQALLPFLPDALYRRLKRRGGAGDPLEGWSALAPDYALRMKVRERALDMGHDTAFRAVCSTRAYRAQMLDNALTESGEIHQALELVHGIPMRDPTAYRPLIEFCLSIPDDQYLRDGRYRWLARRMLAGRIPERVLSETRRGQQAADWALRLRRDREALIGELDTLARDPAMAARFDLARLKAALEHWSPDSAAAQDADTLQHALPRALATAHFIRFVEGTNG